MTHATGRERGFRPRVAETAQRIVEDGTHDELVRAGGPYATLHRMQAGIQEIVR